MNSRYSSSADALFWLDNAPPGFALYRSARDGAQAGAPVVSFLLARQDETRPPEYLSEAAVWQHPGAIVFSSEALRCTAQALAARLRLPTHAGGHRGHRVLRITSLRPFAWTPVPPPWPTDLALCAALHGAATSAAGTEPPPAPLRYPSAWTWTGPLRPRGRGCD
jgi:hypothetical protein